ncbi:MAG: peptide ABC transporter substrate-binding protein [Anaerolineae bacterium]|nr:peptide ABC transporter substrate-binding protein [Anaerolineae bacterium]
MSRLPSLLPTQRYGYDPADTVYLMSGQPRTLDPALTHSGPSGPVGHIFSGLVQLDTSLQVVPDLAAGWQISPDGTRYTFYLHPNARFHDGRPVTAADIIASWERATDPALGSDTALTYLGDITGVPEKVSGTAVTIRGLRALDAHTLEVEIDAPKNYFLAKLAYPVAFVVDTESVTSRDWEQQPNGSGPFVLDTWQDDQRLVLARFDGYYGEPPTIGHVVYLLDAGLPLTRYENGDIDLVGIGGATLERLRDPNNPLSTHLRTGVDMCTSYVGFNATLPPFDDVRVRQAFSHALDSVRLIAGLMAGQAFPANGPLPPGMPGYQDRPAPYPYDPELARALLAEAGYTPATLPPLTYTTAGYGDISPYVVAIITMWEESLGIAIEPQVLDPYIYNDALYGGNLGHLFDLGWCADYPDPENFLDVLYHSRSAQNLGRFSDPALDVALEEARTIADPAARLAAYAAIEDDIVAAAPAVFISHSLSAVLVNPALKNYELTPIGVPQWHRVWLERE